MISAEEFNKLEHKTIGFATWGAVKEMRASQTDRRSFIYKVDVGVDEQGRIRTRGYWPITPMNILRRISAKCFGIQLDNFLRKIKPFKTKES